MPPGLEGAAAELGRVSPDSTLWPALPPDGLRAPCGDLASTLGLTRHFTQKQM